MAVPEYVFPKKKEFFTEYLVNIRRGSVGFGTFSYHEPRLFPQDVPRIIKKEVDSNLHDGQLTTVFTIDSSWPYSDSIKLPQSRLRIFSGTQSTVVIAYDVNSIEIVSGPNCRQFADFLIRDLGLELRKAEKRDFDDWGSPLHERLK